MKWYTIKCSSSEAMMYSPKTVLFSWYCILKETVSTNWATVAQNPARNALKGKLPTRQQNTNCNTPKATKNPRNVSVNRSLALFCSDFLYSSTDPVTAPTNSAYSDFVSTFMSDLTLSVLVAFFIWRCFGWNTTIFGGTVRVLFKVCLLFWDIPVYP